MQTDLHKNAFDTYYFELNIVDAECKMALDHLNDWVAPVAVSTNLTNFPAYSEIRGACRTSRRSVSCC